MKSRWLGVIIAIVATTAAIADLTPPAQMVTVPAFFPLATQSDPSKPRDWLRIQNAYGVHIVVALGADGGFQTLDGTALTDAQNQFHANFLANQLVYGYVDTKSDTRTSLAVQAEVDLWHQRYDSTQIQGIFFDDGPTFAPDKNTLNKSDSDFRADYGGFYGSVHQTYSWQVMLNAAGFPGGSTWNSPNSWVLTDPGADHAIVFEGPKSTYQNPSCTTSPGGYCAIGPAGSGNPAGTLQAPPDWWKSSQYASATYKPAHIV